jgi:alpha-glucosidase
MSTKHPDWWRGAVIYQIYPRSFADSNGDGVGDLKGIAEKLDYVAALGVDGVWISPFFKSPMKDFGYDVASHRDVDPIFGTNDDFDALLSRAHDLGLKVIIDLVLSHTSDEHPWFAESRKDRTNPKADWYVWADPKPDGSPPNNWFSVFGGSAWQWEPRRQQYYLHNYLVSQPDINFHCPAAVDAVMADMEYWLQKGVDGFRFDVVNVYTHDQQLRDNPARKASDPAFDNISSNNPYTYQRHLYDKSRPENLTVINRMRALMDRYGASSVGEISDDDSIVRAAEYTAGKDRLHMAYNTYMLRDKFGAALVAEGIRMTEAAFTDGWPSWSFGNHDVPRVATRWGGEHPPQGFLRALIALQLSLRGSVFIYQGEELGLPDVDVPYHLLRDPFGKTFWPEYKGRDGCRTPMPWVKEHEQAGFTTAQPWLPIPDAHRTLAVDAQEVDPAALLHTYRHLLAWRKTRPELITGKIELLPVEEPVLAFIRQQDKKRLLVVVNLGANKVTYPVAGLGTLTPVADHGLPQGKQNGNRLELGGYEVFYADMT